MYPDTSHASRNSEFTKIMNILKVLALVLFVLRRQEMRLSRKTFQDLAPISLKDEFIDRGASVEKAERIHPWLFDRSPNQSVCGFAFVKFLPIARAVPLDGSRWKIMQRYTIHVKPLSKGAL